MSDSFTSLKLEEFGITFAAVPASQPTALSTPQQNSGCTELDSVGMPLDFENNRQGDSAYCIIS
jgi:hypothetical protein